MPTVQLLPGENLRLTDLCAHQILDTGEDNAFDELLELASDICEASISFISIMDKHRQWFKAKRGISLTEISRDDAFCAHTILQNDVFTVIDATKDERFSKNPFVTGELGVRFYIGAPIVSSEGNNLGTVCLLDTVPRKPTEKQKQRLKIIANQAARLIELHKRNTEVKKEADDIISRKSRSFHKVITSFQEYSSGLSYDLHEVVAQTIASSRFYLRLAQEDQASASEHINTVIEQLDKVVDDVRLISYKMTPPGIRILNIGETVKDSIAKTQHLFPYKIHLETHNSIEVINSNITVLLLKMLHEWLHVLKEQGNTADIFIELSLDENVNLKISDSISQFDFQGREKEIWRRTIGDRVQAFDGHVRCTSNCIQIELPAIKPEVKTGDDSNLSVY